MALQIGDQAPNFTLPNTDGDTITLYDYLGVKPVVIFFYPKAFSPACTMEVCSFRDQYADFVELGAEVIGISSDGEGTQQQFAKTFKVPFPILSDRGGKVRKAWDVPKTMGVLDGRVTYILDKDGVVQQIYNNQMMAIAHIGKALKALRTFDS